MCGICGYAAEGPMAHERSILERMNSAIQHRGPDDAGFYFSENSDRGGSCAMAMRRLSIIDLSTGHQPISGENQNSWIVYNGEVYNYLELRGELEALGHEFRTNTDTEVLLHAYDQYGPACVKRFRGMFALAIWEQSSRKLFLARDPVGIKPLFYTLVENEIVFASEIKALLAFPGVRRQLNEDALPHFLTYLYVPHPETMFAGIYQLAPGHSLTYQNGKIQIEEFWAGPTTLISSGQHLANSGQPAPSPEEVWEGLSESVAAHLASDVPVGAFLSGGMDSSAIVAIMASHVGLPVKTFSIGFRGSGLYDESPFAEKMAHAVGADHEVLQLDEGCVERLPEILRCLDEPMADASIIPNYYLAEMARKSVKVVLSGIGGDELFGGYRRYSGHQMAEFWLRLPRLARERVLDPALRMLPSDGSTRFGDRVRLANKFIAPLHLPPRDRYIAWNSFYTEAEKHALLCQPGSNGSSATLYHKYFRRAQHRDFADQAMYVDLKTYLPGDPLLLGDRLTMAHGLEARVPFLDIKFMELAARIPAGKKIGTTQTKTILREACRGRIPLELLKRPKQGFGTPIDLWLRRDSAKLVNQLLSPDAVRQRGIFNPQAVQSFVAKLGGRGQDVSQHVWALVIFELWARTFLDQDYSQRKNLTFADLGVNV
jgi:asparagine synthase (glutamine-hydrolysing)